MLTVEGILLAKGPDGMVATSATTVLEATRQMAEANVGSMVIENSAERESENPGSTLDNWGNPGATLDTSSTGMSSVKN